MAQEIADSTLLDTWASSGLIVEPDVSKIIEGWQLGEQPPHEYMNWLQNTFGSKLNHILKNGVALWNNETEYLAGSSVQHNGNVWLCKATNTNSAPTDANVNWKRIITVEALTTVLAGYVATTGNQTIEGIKTFSSNPISSATQSTAVNALTRKDYVDTKAPLASPAFTGTPTAPTPTVGDNSTKVATTAYVLANLAPTNLGITNGTTAGPIITSSTGTNATLPTASATVSGVMTTGNQTIAGVKTFTSNIVGNITGNSATATTLQTARTINGVSFDGSANITVSDSTAVKLTGNQTIEGIKTFSSSPIVPAPTTNFQAATKKYVDDNISPEYNPTPIIATGTATFTATTNNINLTGIGIGVEIGDVIQISGATDSKNNSEFTVEVITDNDNVIVNQAHANKGTSKNVATRAGDTGVTVVLLAKWYNASEGIGQNWVNVIGSRSAGVTYTNSTGRTIAITIIATMGGANMGLVGIINGVQVAQSYSRTTASYQTDNILLIVPALSTYQIDTNGVSALVLWSEFR